MSRPETTTANDERPVTLTDLGLFAVCARRIEARWEHLTVERRRRALALLSELSAATRIPKGAPARRG